MPDLIDATAAAQLLGVSRQTLYSYVSRGLLHPQAARSGQGKRYLRSEVEQLLRRSRQARQPRAAAGGSLDFGLPVLQSALCLIENGQLWYRGQNALELAAQHTLEDIAELLWACEGDNPFATALPASALQHEAAIVVGALHPYDIAFQRFPALALTAPQPAETAGAASLRAHCAWLLRAMTSAILNSPPAPDLIHVQCAKAWGLNGAQAERVRHALVLCADHELNASSFTTRCIASTDAPLHAAVLGGLAALSGKRHGRAMERIEHWLEQLGNAPDDAACHALFAPHRHVSGFGHRLYPLGDPRAAAILQQIGEPFAPEVCAFALREYGEYPNLDLALLALARDLHLPEHAASVIFAIGRTVGWLAHALEQSADKQLIRPRAHYTGKRPASPNAKPIGRIIRMGRA